MKTRFAYKSIIVAANAPNSPEFEGNFLYVYSVTGTVEMNLGFDGEWIPLRTGLQLQTDRHETFDKVRLRSTAGGTAIFYYGFGLITTGSSSSGGSGSAQIIVGASADPNAGAVVPADPASAAIYYYDNGATVSFWIWSIIANSWLSVVS